MLSMNAPSISVPQLKPWHGSHIRDLGSHLCLQILQLTMLCVSWLRCRVMSD